MELERFFLPDLHAGDGELPADQAHHAVHVLRLKAGDAVMVFDGQGNWATAQIQSVTGAVVRVRCGEVQKSGCVGPRLTLATAVPKLDRADFLVQAASQLNVDAIQWLDCQRSVVKPDGQGKKIEKWRRLAVESAKQCGRNYLLRVEPMLPVSTFFQSLDPSEVMWANPQGDSTLAGAWNHWQQTKTRSSPLPRLTVFIGPEGGWTESEEQMFRQAGAVGVRLGPHILRIEIAAMAVAALIGCSETMCLK